ncbi:MAG: dihydrofolate reductase [Ornithinimicrobium sp.]|uniref:dihydrofolate reductase n=1 Tax=Ornithinimicrobium sp. TaxID=1977084 RepID=UPI003D9B4A78
MTQARFSVVPSVYLALLREGAQGPEVLLQLRQGTPYMDGWWACGAAGHVERGESALAAAVREAREELGIAVDPDDLEPLATLHRTCALADPVEQRIDLFMVLREWDGEPLIAEPDKAADLRWWPLDALPDRVVPHEAQALDALRARHIPAVLTRGFAQSLTLVAAVGRNGVIGDGASMPWHLPEDLAHFKRTTMGGVMLMGRLTFDSIGRALPGRRSIVITRDSAWAAEGVQVAHSMPEALLVAGDEQIFVIGGGEIYAQTIDIADRLVITQVDQEPDGSVHFPAIDPRLWRETSREPGDGLTFVTWERH